MKELIGVGGPEIMSLTASQTNAVPVANVVAAQERVRTQVTRIEEKLMELLGEIPVATAVSEAEGHKLAEDVCDYTKNLLLLSRSLYSVNVQLNDTLKYAHYMVRKDPGFEAQLVTLGEVAIAATTLENDVTARELHLKTFFETTKLI